MDRHEVIERIRTEDASLERHIEQLTVMADRAPRGVREYRHHRLDQLREKQHGLRRRIHRVEAHEGDGWDDVRPEAERLVYDIQNTVTVAQRTFR